MSLNTWVPEIVAGETFGRSTTILILFGIGPKQTWKCGKCGTQWKARIRYSASTPFRKCPSCMTWNYNDPQWA